MCFEYDKSSVEYYKRSGQFWYIHEIKKLIWVNYFDIFIYDGGYKLILKNCGNYAK